MKKYIAFLMPCIAAMLASCTQNEDLTNTDNGRLQAVTISVTPDDGMQTRATTEVSIDRYVMEVYEADGTPANVFSNGTNRLQQNDSGMFSLNLDRTKTYKCLFWADYGAGEVYDVSNLKAVSVKDGKEPIEASYYGVQSVSGAKESYMVRLKRAVARITLYEKDYIKGGSTLKVTCNRYTAFNVSDGTGVGDGSEITSNISVASAIETTAEKPVLIDTLYLFAPTTEARLLDFTFQLGDETPKIVRDVPVRANHATNIKGEFSHVTRKAFIVTADDEWGTPNKEGTLLTVGTDYTYTNSANTQFECIVVSSSNINSAVVVYKTVQNENKAVADKAAAIAAAESVGGRLVTYAEFSDLATKFGIIPVTNTKAYCCKEYVMCYYTADGGVQYETESKYGSYPLYYIAFDVTK